MKGMPISVQCVLSDSEGVEFTKLAEIADLNLGHHTISSHGHE